MLVLGSVVMALIALGLIIGYSFGGLVFTHNRLQASADEIALAGARKLNENDRIGQMNNMIARSRQLVFYSREQLEKAGQDYPQLNAIAQELLDETRDSAESLETERKKVRVLAQQEAIAAMQAKFNQIKGTYPMTLPWLKVGMPNNLKMRMGRMNNVESNVELLKNIEELESQDKSKGLVINSPGLKLYQQGINAKLPGADADLDFKICSLAAPVEKTVSPAHIAMYKACVQQPEKEIPSCTQVEISLSVATGLGAAAQQKIKASSTAACTGASPQQ